MMDQDYLKGNEELWDQKTKAHVDSEFYNMEEFRRTKNSLKPIELGELPDLNGKRVLHLQCHFGQDSISLANRGALVTAIDLSGEAIKYAKGLSEELAIPVDFIKCNVYDVPDQVQGQFDLIFASYGTICWLPDLDRWAEVIQKKLSPGGQLYFAEFHPFVDTLDGQYKNFGYPYFNEGAMSEHFEGTYADNKADITVAAHFWNHPISEVLNALLSKGFSLEFFNEYDYTPWPCFPNLKERKSGEWVFEHMKHSIPMVYSFLATYRG